MADNTASFSLHGAPLDILPQNPDLSVSTNAVKEVSDQNPSDQNRFAFPQKSQVHVCAYASDHIHIVDAPTQRHLDIVYEAFLMSPMRLEGMRHARRTRRISRPLKTWPMCRRRTETDK